MRKLAAIALLAATFAYAEDSRLVEAAKASGGPKKKKSTKVITNDDVKKSTGKLTELPGEGAEAQKAPGDPSKSTLEKHNDKLRAAESSAKRIAASEKMVADLESQLAKIEQSYYESTDPDYRDKTIKAQFNDTKRALDVARKALNDAKAAAPAPAPVAAKTQ